MGLAERTGRGVVVLVKNSNPGAPMYQDLDCGGRRLYEVVAESLTEFQDRLSGPQTGWSSLGVTTAAMLADHSRRIRSILPQGFFLVLGYGAQGGTARDAVAGFVPGPNGLEGGLVNASVLFPTGADMASATQWEAAIDIALKSAIEELGEAVLKTA